MITNIIALYPGRFQPFGKHHAASFKWLESEFGGANCYIVTSNVTSLPKSPFSFKDKQDIISQYELNDRLVQVKHPYKSEEILSKLNPKDTAVVFMVGQKDMNTNPRFKIGKKVSGGDSYYQNYKKNKSNLKGFNEHGYLIVAPHISIKIPGFGEMSGTTLRKALGAKKPRSQKIEQFKAVFGWYNKKTADMIFDKLEPVNESKIPTTLFSKQWWGDSLELNESISIDELKSKFKKFIVNIKQESTETKEAFVLLTKAATGKIVLSDAQKMQIGEQMKDVLKSIGLTTLAIVPGGIIAALIIKLLKAEKYVTPSSFIKEVKKDKNDPCWSGYRQYGMKKKGNKKVPNCVAEHIEEGSMSTNQQKTHNKKINKLKSFLNSNIGREFEYDFDQFSKTVFGVKIEENSILLKEGGAGGHMHHVFNIEWVKTGKDLIKAFQMSINYLKKSPAAVKIDGINASIRLITIDNKKQFVMDRGSNKPLDVKGIAKAELTDRFGEGHGMIVIGGKVLDIFNESIPDITNDLKKLGLWDNPNIMFNIEYVSGSSNVLSYNKNFLAIHGLLEISQITPTKRATKEKSYNKAAMQKLLNNLAASAGNYGYEVLGSIPTVLDGTPNLTAELNKKYTITFNVDTKEEKSLSQWLATAKVPTENIKTIDGKSIAALSKEVLIKISDGIPLSEYIADTKDYQAAADGFVIYMATMKLGDSILEKLNSPLGPVAEHEGIVIRDTAISDKPFKITGSFIIKGMQSSFRK